MTLPQWWFYLVALAAVLLAAVYAVAPANLSVVLYKVALLSLAAVVSTVLDRLYFKPQDKDNAHAPLARALVFVGVVLSLSLGL